MDFSGNWKVDIFGELSSAPVAENLVKKCRREGNGKSPLCKKPLNDSDKNQWTPTGERVLVNRILTQLKISL
jgi:hypothetical protein